MGEHAIRKSDGERVKNCVVQPKHDRGLLANVPCCHGERLPEGPPNGKVFWNGKEWAYSQQRN